MARPHAVLLFALVAPVLLAACDNFPRDPDGTIDRLRGGILRVGLIENPPWAHFANGTAAGVEVELVERLAADPPADIQWTTGSAEALFRALEARSLDIVIGGLTNDSPWRGRVVFTSRFASTEILVARVGGATGETESIAGRPVAAPPGSSLAAAVAAAGGRPVPPGEAEGLVARHDWELRDGEVPVAILHRSQHVLALPPGENAWLMHLEGYLRLQEPAVREALAEAGG